MLIGVVSVMVMPGVDDLYLTVISSVLSLMVQSSELMEALWVTFHSSRVTFVSIGSINLDPVQLSHPLETWQ